MLLSMKHQALGSTTLVVVLAASSLAFAGVEASNPDASVATSGRAGAPASLSSEPTQPPQVLTDAYEWTKASVARAYEKTKEFLVESSQGQVSKQRAARSGAWQQAEIDARKPISSGAGIGAFGRAGAQNYTERTSQPPPQAVSDAYDKTKAYVKHAYDQTKEFLAQATQPATTEQPTSLGGI